jgi:carbon monoxide dehydrogenase subunit G
MEMTGEVTIPAPRQRVWEGLNDTETLRQAIPGCEKIEKTSDTEFTATVVAKVGPVKASFQGKVTLSDIDPPNGYRISGEGKGGVGFAKGGATVTLTDADGGTRLAYTVDAQVGGKLAQLGSRLIDGTAKSMANDFFGRFAALVSDPTETEIEEEVREGLVPPPPEGVPDEDVALDKAIEQSRALPPWIWIGGTVLLIALILVLVTYM